MARSCATTSSAAERRLAGAAGFTIVELLMAIALLGTVALAAGALLASSTGYANDSEVRQNLANRAQQEVERLASLDYAALVHAAAPAPATGPQDPRSFYDAATGTYRWDRSAGGAGTAEQLVVPGDSDGDGDVDAEIIEGQTGLTTPTTWSDGTSGGRLFAFVTWVDDPRCGNACPQGTNYKRITVAATLDTGGPPVAPVYVSSIVADPYAAPAGRVVNGNANPLTDPSITCRDASGAVVQCTASVGSSNVNQWFLTDTPATRPYAPPSGSHPTHPTVAPVGPCTSADASGCPVPDLLSPDAPPAQDPQPPLADYSTDVTGVPRLGGRVLARDVSCGDPPTAVDNTRGAMWVTEPLTQSTTLTGSGGMTLYSQAPGGVAAGATLCLAVYSAGGSIANLVQTPPVRLGVVAYTVAQWPAQPTPVSFSFDFLTTGSISVAAGNRIGARLWVAADSATDLVAMYDHPSFASVLQLNSQ